MATIPGQQTINIGLPNEAANSDSLYTAFSKTQNNFTTLFNTASPYTNFVDGAGISTNANATTGTLSITNTGVTSIVAGSNVTISSSNGAVTISAGGGGGGGGVTSVGVVGASDSARIIASGTNPVVSTGTIVLDLTTTGVTAGTYTYPTLTVDDYGRINNISNGSSVGTVTSVGVIAGPGILVTGSPVTSNGEMTVVNTGVVRLNAGTGIALTDSTGNITISTAQGVGTVTSIDIVSSTLNITGSPVVSTGSVIIDTFSLKSGVGPLDDDGGGNLSANLTNGATYFSTTGASTATLADGAEGQVKTFMMVADGGDMVVTVANAGWGGSGTMTFNDQGDGCTLQYANGKWYCVGNNGVTFG